MVLSLRSKLKMIFLCLISVMLLPNFVFAQTHLVKFKNSDRAKLVDLENIDQRRDIDYIERNYQIQAHATPADPDYQRQSMYMNLIEAPSAWNYIDSSPEITIAVIDSGIDLDHPDLAANIWTNPNEIPDNNIDDDKNGLVDDIHGYNFLENNASVQDINGHGSKISGIIGAVGQNDTGIVGISWHCKIMVLKILDQDGNSTVNNAIRAIDYAINNGAKIINASWGFHAGSTPEKYSRSLYEAIARAQEKGILFVSSVGNGENYIGQNNDAAEKTNFPSSYDLENIISVASSNLKDELAFFSNYGLYTVDIAAPGIDIYSTDYDGGYSAMTGTSISAAFVTGAAALLWQLNPELEYQEIKSLLIDNSESIMGVTGKDLLGGRLNINNSLEGSPAILGIPISYNESETQGSNEGFNIAELPNSDAVGGCQLNTTKNNPLNFLAIFLSGFIFFGFRFFRFL